VTPSRLPSDAGARRVGFVGLGRLGVHMARHLVEAGHDVVVHDVVDDPVTHLVRLGARAGSSPRDVAEQSDIVLTSLPGPPEVEMVVFGDDGLLAADVERPLLIDLTTSSLELTRRVAEAYRAAGGSAVDAPVSGSPTQAEAGAMTIWASGDESIIDEARPLLGAFSTTVIRVGDSGSGTVTKLAHNLASYIAHHALGEVFSLGVAAGVDPLELWSAMKRGMLGRTSVLDILPSAYLPGDYDNGSFTLRLAHKDVALGVAMADELGVPAPLATSTLAEMGEGIARGYADQDARAFLKVQLDRAGVDIAVDRDRLSAALDAVSR
jgi:3-hydroxyisobutyrate dehydrogenase